LIGDRSIVDKDGAPSPHADRFTEAVIAQDTLVEVDDQPASVPGYQRIRTPAIGMQDAFLITEVFASDIVDLRARYALWRINEIETEKMAGVLTKSLPRWIDEGQRIHWTAKAPAQLTAEEWVTPIKFTDTSFTVRDASGNEVELPLGAFDTGSIEFERSAEEAVERAGKLDDRKDLPVLSIDQVLTMLRGVPLLDPYLKTPKAATIEMAGAAQTFELACAMYLMATPAYKGKQQQAMQQALLVNAYADVRSNPRAIHLRPGAQGVGTEVHEYLHTQNAAGFDRVANFFLSEGITEYLTRMATDGVYVRAGMYDDPYDFMMRLVELGATDDGALAALYFADGWDAFVDGLRHYAGDLVSVETLVQEADHDKSLAALEYLKELRANPEAPIEAHLSALAQ
jgi:hypothetical protein